jgi:hypothetical protein
VPGIWGRRLPPEFWEVLTACLILAWRIFSYPAATLWQDWVALMAVTWIATVFAGRSKAGPLVLGLMMVFLFALYAAHQVPLSLGVLGSLR